MSPSASIGSSPCFSRPATIASAAALAPRRRVAPAVKSLRHRRDRARSEGRLHGIGFTAVVEPAISNMGYIATVLSPEERDQAGPKHGAQAAATVSLDPLGGVSVTVDSVPQGQGHRTATAQIVADIFGLAPEAIRVEAAIDTGKDAWSGQRLAATECGSTKWLRR